MDVVVWYIEIFLCVLVEGGECCFGEFDLLLVVECEELIYICNVIDQVFFEQVILFMLFVEQVVCIL